MPPRKTYIPSVYAPSGLNYADCTATELRGFLEARTGRKYASNTAKRILVEALRDEDATVKPFDFMGLPPELRNHVYRNLLTLRPKTWWAGLCCKPAILRANKQIYGEAAGVMYGDNEAEVVVECRLTHAMPHASVANHLQRNVNILNCGMLTRQCCWINSLRQWPRVAADLPPQLQMFQNVKLVVRLVHDDPTVGQPRRLAVAANHMLYKVVSFMARSSHLKKINLEVSIKDKDGPTTFDESLLRQALWPAVVQLPQRLVLKMNGLPDGMEAHLRSLQRPHDGPPELLIQRCLRLYDRAANLKNAMVEVKGSFTRQDQLHGWMYELKTMLDTSEFVNDEFANRLLLKAADFDEILASNLVNQVETAFNTQIRKLRKMRGTLRG